MYSLCPSPVKLIIWSTSPETDPHIHTPTPHSAVPWTSQTFTYSCGANRLLQVRSHAAVLRLLCSHLLTSSSFSVGVSTRSLGSPAHDWRGICRYMGSALACAKAVVRLHEVRDVSDVVVRRIWYAHDASAIGNLLRRTVCSLLWSQAAYGRDGENKSCCFNN